MAIASHVNENAFCERRQRDWEELDVMVLRASRMGVKKLDTDAILRFSPLYRDICADLARAQAARYSAPLVDYLQGLAAAAHTVLYGLPSRTRHLGDQPFRNLVYAFPRAVRRHRRALLLAACLFFIPFAAGLALALHDPTFAFRLAPEGMLKPLAEAYAKGFEEGRANGDNAMMAGFYIHNNVGIALRCFALGILGGLGSALYLLQNGLAIGAIVGYVASKGAGQNILTFIVGHGSLELGAIVIAGGAGLVLGYSLVSPGEKTRLASLQAAGREVVVLVAGASVMLMMAAGIEAFWSGSSVPTLVKRITGATIFVLLGLYLTLAGRASRAPSPRESR